MVGEVVTPRYRQTSILGVEACTQDANPTQAIGKLHHTLEAETPIARSLLTEFFNKLMRVQRKHHLTNGTYHGKETKK